MKLLVAVKSCPRDLKNGCHEAIRQTWGKDFQWYSFGLRKIDLKFFVGTAEIDVPVLQEDEVVVKVPTDTLESLPDETKQIAKFAVEKGYDFVFLCDNDTFIRPDRLLACGFEHFDYCGQFEPGYNGLPRQNFQDGRLGNIGTVWPYCSGGVGYFLSRRAAELVAEMPIVHYAEDLCVGQVLSPLVAQGKLSAFQPMQFEKYAAWHFCTWGHTKYQWPHSVGFDPRWQYESYVRGAGE